MYVGSVPERLRPTLIYLASPRVVKLHEGWQQTYGSDLYPTYLQAYFCDTGTGCKYR
jgi:hypothetical protein